MSPPVVVPYQGSCPGAQQVLDAARELFAEHGIDAVSMQDVATKAGVSKANVFHHFASKEALYISVMRACVMDDQTNIPALIASPAPFEERFLALMKSELKSMLDDPRGTRLVIREVTNGNVERAKLIATQIFSDKVLERVAFFEDARARGELRDGVEPIVCDMLLGACCMFHFNCMEVSQHITGLIGRAAPRGPEAFARAMCNALTHGLSPQPGPVKKVGRPARVGPTGAKPALKKAAAARRSKPSSRRQPSRSP